MIVIFIISITLFVFIGISSVFKKKSSTKDYLLASQSVKPWLVALSAVATNNSGYMFIGMIGYTYVNGLESIWLMLGWIIGDFIGSLLVYGNLRNYSSKYGLLSFGSLLSNNKGDNIRVLQVISGVISFLFLSTYASAQFVAGGKALHVILNWEVSVGILIGAIMVVVYCFSGGIRASIWTDAAQSIVMIFAMIILLSFAIDFQGGFQMVFQNLKSVSNDYMSFFDSSRSLHMAGIFTLGWFFAGFGVVGQPHIMVRYMALDKAKNIGKVRMYYYSWFTFFYASAIGVGLLSRIILPESSGFDSEMALPMMSIMLLPDFLVGIMIAGIFAATISTADSLVIGCTAAITNDIFPKYKYNYTAGKLFTIFITSISVLIAIWGNTSVFKMVTYSWAVLGSSFGPLVVMRMVGVSVGKITSISMVMIGGGVAVLWSALGYSSIVYEMMPGIMTGFLIFLTSTFLKKIRVKA